MKNRRHLRSKLYLAALVRLLLFKHSAKSLKKGEKNLLYNTIQYNKTIQHKRIQKNTTQNKRVQYNTKNTIQYIHVIQYKNTKAKVGVTCFPTEGNACLRGHLSCIHTCISDIYRRLPIQLSWFPMVCQFTKQKSQTITKKKKKLHFVKVYILKFLNRPMQVN